LSIHERDVAHCTLMGRSTWATIRAQRAAQLAGAFFGQRKRPAGYWAAERSSEARLSN